jgi:hypothetical protein
MMEQELEIENICQEAIFDSIFDVKKAKYAC